MKNYYASLWSLRWHPTVSGIMVSNLSHLSLINRNLSSPKDQSKPVSQCTMTSCITNQAFTPTSAATSLEDIVLFCMSHRFPLSYFSGLVGELPAMVLIIGLVRKFLLFFLHFSFQQLGKKLGHGRLLLD